MSLYLTVDGRQWTVERRHGMAQLATRATTRERPLYLFFATGDGEMRRTEIPEDFPTDPDAQILASVWEHAEVLRSADLGEMQSRTELVMPTIRDTVRMIWRSVRLRCPHCGGSKILRTWFSLKVQCPTCGIRLERGEGEDYYIGGMMFNIALAEAIFCIGFGVTLFVMWPNVPWDGLEYGLVAAMIAAPIILYPVSRIMWFGFDLLFRPASREEMAWHRQNGAESTGGSDLPPQARP